MILDVMFIILKVIWGLQILTLLLFLFPLGIFFKSPYITGITRVKNYFSKISEDLNNILAGK